MAPRVTKPKEDGTPDVLKPKTEKAKVEKAKTPKVKAEKAEKIPKVEKIDKAEKAPKVVKPKPEKLEKPEKAGAGKVDGKAGEKAVKVKPVNGDEAVGLILEYLKATNRPYSATEVSANLHGKVTKTVADKLLKELGEAKTIGMNSTKKDEKGSQFVFWTLQDPADAASPEELAAMDVQIASLKSSMPSVRTALKTSTTKLSTLKSALSTSELQTIIFNLRVSNAEKREKLAGFKNGEVKQVSKDDMARAEKEFKYWGAKKKSRKDAYVFLEDMVTESGAMTREAIREHLDVEEE